MTDLREQLQGTLGSAYTLERELGGGGMSRVFIADETRLGRKVVVKVLSPELAAGISAERFEREIRTAASLQQANIVPVLSAGDAGGLPYFTMPFVEGESLRKRLSSGAPLTVTEVTRILGDVARALGYAHDRHIVHRDIKPDNVLLSHGTAVVTDFGIAKAISASRTSGGSATLTQLGTAIGTPAYMSPEQAAGDPDIDHRADIYAFGCMAYEMLAGRPPFVGTAPQRILAAQMAEPPRALSEMRPDLPVPLADLVMQCLAKDPVDRPATASDMVRVLDTVTSGSSAAAPQHLQTRMTLGRALLLYVLAVTAVAILARAAVVGIGLPGWVFPGAMVVMALGLPMVLVTSYVHRSTYHAVSTTPRSAHRQPGAIATMALKASPHVTWGRTARWGAYAVGTFALMVAVFMVLRAKGIGPAGSLFGKGTLSASDKVLVADFRAPSSDSALGGVISEALRTNLSQSRAIRVVPPTAIAEGLRRMEKAPSTPLTTSLARELAEREGMKAIVTGDLTPAGGGYLVTARIVESQAGVELALFHEAARDATDIMPAIDRLSRDIRSKIGESLKRVNASPTLEQVTTASLPAFRKYVEGMRLHYRDANYRAAAAAFEEAIRLDTTFATAIMRATNSYSNANLNFPRRDSLREKMFAMRGRLPELERNLILGNYYNVTAIRFDSAIHFYEKALALDSTSSSTLNVLGNLYRAVNRPARAETVYRQAIALNDGNFQPAGNLLGALFAQGKFAAMKAEIALSAREQNRPTRQSFEALLAIKEGRYDQALAIIDSARKPRTNSIARAADGWYALTVLMGGRTRKGLAALDADRRAAVADFTMSPEEAAVRTTMDSIHAENWLEERHPEALARLDRLMAQHPATSRGFAEPLLLDAVAEYAYGGQPAKAKALLARFDASRDSAMQRAAYSRRHLAAAEIALAERRYGDAVSAIQTARNRSHGEQHGCQSCLDIELARVYDQQDMADSAIVMFERFVNTNETSQRFNTGAKYLAGTFKRLGELYERKGDQRKAASYYAKFVQLWKDADPELQPKVAEIRKRLARLRSAEVR